jgi:integrase
VHLPKELADDLWLWKQECPDSSPEAFIFPDANGGFMDTGNYRRRVLHKLAKDLELPKLTFQVIRRTIAHAGAEEGNSEGRSGTSPAFPCGHNDRRVYAGNPGERRSNRQRD